MSIRVRLIIYLLAFFIPASAAITAVVYWQSRAIVEENIQNVMGEIANNTMQTMDMLFHERYMDMRMMASDPVLASTGATVEHKRERLEQYLRQSRSYISFSLFTDDRVRIADTAGLQVGERHPLNSYWVDMEKNGGWAFDVYFSDTLQTALFYMAQRLYDPKSHKSSGVMVTRVSLAEIDKIVELVEGSHGPGKDLFRTGLLGVELVNRNGYIVYSNAEKEKVLKSQSPFWSRIQEAKRANQRLYSLVEKPPGRNILTFVADEGHGDFKGSGWTLILSLDKSVVFDKVSFLERKLAQTLLIALVAGLVAVFLVARSITLPLERLTMAVKSVAQGDYHKVTDIDDSGEIGNLARVFDHMVGIIEEKRSELVEYTHGLEREIEERARVQKALEAAKEEAEEANRIKDRFMSLLAHDLRSPLATIYSFANLIEESEGNKLSDISKKGLNAIGNSSIALINQISALLDNTLIKSGKIAPKLRQTPLAEIVGEVFGLLEHQAKMKGVTLDCHGCDRMVLADPILMGRVLQNLITNSIKFSGNGGQVRVEYRDAPKECLAVTDQGVGIRPENLATLFDLSKSVSTKGTSGEKGSGLGLPICQEIMQAMGGGIRVESIVGKGSVFYIDLPTAPHRP